MTSSTLAPVQSLLKVVPILGLLVASFMFESCYSLNGISISSTTETYHVAQFDVNTPESPADLGQRFSELLKQKVNSETRLAFDENDPDVEFTGAIVTFTVTPESANANNRSDLSRLTVSVSVDYVDTITEKNSYTMRFTEFELFDSSVNLFDVQDQLLADIFQRITEDAFNKAFSNW